MISNCNEVFSAAAESLRSAFEGIKVVGEYVDSPTEGNTVTLDEIENVPIYVDSSKKAKYARVKFRVQIFSNKVEGKRAMARKIFGHLDEFMQSIGLFCKTYTSTPTIYNSEIYAITATYEAVIDANGVIYRV